MKAKFKYKDRVFFKHGFFEGQEGIILDREYIPFAEDSKFVQYKVRIEGYPKDILAYESCLIGLD